MAALELGLDLALSPAARLRSSIKYEQSGSHLKTILSGTLDGKIDRGWRKP
ncbi:MAG: hypothetical protein ACLTYW_07640 [Collinsella sp.]